jgi:hypothetical protein
MSQSTISAGRNWFRDNSVYDWSRRIELALLSLLIGWPAWAGEITRSAAPTAANPVASPTNAANAAAMAQRTQRAAERLSRTTQTLQALQAAQSAARAAALNGPNNLGLNPNQPGVQLPDVQNGLAAGGLVPDSGLSSNGVANSVTTWVGANT